MKGLRFRVGVRPQDHLGQGCLGAEGLRRSSWRPRDPKATRSLLLIPCHPVQELAQLKTRTALEVQAKEAEVTQLRQQLAQHEAARWGLAAAVTRTVPGSCTACLGLQNTHPMGVYRMYCVVLCFVVTDIRLGVGACPAPVLTPLSLCVGALLQASRSRCC